MEADPWDEPIVLFLSAFSKQIRARLTGQLLNIYVAGSTQMIEWGRTKTTDRPIFNEGPPMRQAFEYADARCARLVTQMDIETKDRLAKVVGNAIRDKEGIPNLARNIRREFADMTKYRSQMIARTETADALEQAFMDRSRDIGVTGKRWVVSDPCDVCMANGNLGTVPLDEAPYFDVNGNHILRPPAHPNAVFEGSTFAPYGSLTQIVRSRYSGPATTIETERVTFTIGPNHPVLAGRGWIKAGEVHEGDYLLYDTRADVSRIATVESNLDKMIEIEDAFNTLRAMFGDSIIATARAYLHGDEVFAYGEVQVILPMWDLLPILNPYGVEKLSKCDLVGTYPNALHIAGCSSCRDAFERVFVATTSFVSGGNLRDTNFVGHGLPSPFECVRVVRAHKTSYSGYAYDASTQYGLYNSSGIVVKNCRCALAPVMLEEG